MKSYRKNERVKKAERRKHDSKEYTLREKREKPEKREKQRKPGERERNKNSRV